MKVRCLSCMKEYEDEFDICPFCGYVKDSQAKDIYMLVPGTILADRYIIGEAVGVGGFAITYKAWDTKLETQIVIKEYFPENVVNRVGGKKNVFLCSGQSHAVKSYRVGLERFLLEAKNTAQFNQHENIVHVYDYFEENQTAYYTMEYMEGMDLSHYIRKKGGVLDVEEVITILLSVINALKTVHGIGAIHRDISPDNIFLLNNGKVKLFDFGAARFSEKDEDNYDPVIKQGYAPPEQYDKKAKQGPWTDIYALGATMYRAITGVLPQESVKRLEEGDEVKRPREVNEVIPEYIDACLTRAMSIEPAFRFKNIEEFEEVLLSKRTVRSESEEQAFRKKVRRVTVTIVSCIILIGAMIGYQMYDEKKTEAALEPANIVVWVPVEPEEDMETMISIYREMSVEFMTAYPDVSIEFIGVTEETYAQNILNEEVKKPTLYRSDLVANTSIKAMELNEVFELITMNEYYFLKSYEKVFSVKDRIPLGIEIPVGYCKINAIEDNLSLNSKNDENAFYEGVAGVYVGSSAEYSEVQKALPGQYIVSEVESDVEAVISDCWSVNAQAQENETAAAERLLYYWIGEKAQDIMHIQNTHFIPINKAMAKEFFGVNGELDFLQDKLEELSFTDKDENSLREYCTVIYEEVYANNVSLIEEILQEEMNE